MLINALAVTPTNGTLNTVTINSYDSGKIKVHVFAKVGDVFTSIANKEIDIIVGTNTYDIELAVFSVGLYVGLEISATYAGARTFSKGSGKEGYYGGSNGVAATFVDGGLICYGFTMLEGDSEPRPKEVEDFKKEILQEAGGGAQEAGCQLYRYNMNSSSADFVQSGWTFSENGATPPTQGVAGRLYVKKQINIETKIQRCLVTLYADTNLVLYTEGREESSLTTAVSVNFSNKTILVHDKKQ